MARVWIAVAFALLVCGAAPPEPMDSIIERAWQKGKAELEPAGITRQTVKEWAYWVELQYNLGLCRDEVDGRSFVRWRNWWDGSGLEQTEAGREMIKAGNDVFNEGVKASVGSKAEAKACRSLLAEWATTMTRVVSERPLPNAADEPAER